MRYRQLDGDGDYRFGRGGVDFLRDTPETVAQAVVTRLRLLRGEWFLDLQEGTPHVGGIWGKHTKESFEPVLRARILGTEGVTEITEFEWSWDPESRALTVSVSINTVYGATTISEVL